MVLFSIYKAYSFSKDKGDAFVMYEEVGLHGLKIGAGVYIFLKFWFGMIIGVFLKMLCLSWVPTIFFLFSSLPFSILLGE